MATNGFAIVPRICGCAHNDRKSPPCVAMYVHQGYSYNWTRLSQLCQQILAPHQAQFLLRPAVFSRQVLENTSYDQTTGDRIMHYSSTSQSGSNIALTGGTGSGTLGPFFEIGFLGSESPSERIYALTCHHVLEPLTPRRSAKTPSWQSHDAKLPCCGTASSPIDRRISWSITS